jgi:xanthine dehydrogenase accessory factor
MNSLCSAALRFFRTDNRLALVSMMDQSGSAPRTAGARMLVRPDGSLWGTVGGGRYEAEAISLATAMLRQPEDPELPQRFHPGAVMEFSLAGVSDMDMICGGRLSLLVEALPQNDYSRGLFQAAQAAETARQPYLFISRFQRDKASAEAMRALSAQGVGPAMQAGEAVSATVERLLYLPNTGELLPVGSEVPPAVTAAAQTLQGLIPTHMTHDGEEYLLEPFPRSWRLIIFGGGHVSLELARLAAGLDFSLIVLDDRPEFANSERFPQAEAIVPETLQESDCAAALAALAPTPCDAIVIVTRGHSHDRDALAAALPTQAGYIGMIGSRSKRLAIYAALEKRGFSPEQLAAVRSPIGLPIGAETPAEIAVSIAAELIGWRAGVSGS